MAIAGAINIMAAASVPTVVDVAVRAEVLGFDRCWLYDEGLKTRDVYVALSAIALATERMQLGPGITNPYTRHPGATAAAVATLDELSGGRAFVAVGAGGVLTLQPLALNRTQPARAVEEMVATMQRLFSGEAVDFVGDTLTYSNAELAWARPGIEVWVAGRGPRIIEVGSRLADGIHLSYIHKRLLTSTVNRIRTAETGRRVRLSYKTALVTNDDEFERARAELTFRVVDSPAEVQELVGVTPEEITALRAALAGGGPAAAARHVRPEWVEQFALVGDPDDCAAQLAVMAERYGFEEFLVGLSDLEHADAVMRLTFDVLQRT